MFTIYTKSFIAKFLFITLFLLAANALFAQNKQETSVQAVTPEITEFTYQGRLLDNSLPANGTYDFQFNLKDNNTVLGTVQRNGVSVVNGIFTVRLDFGLNFPAGQPRFLEISVKPGGSAAYTPLTPAQPITATPFAVHSADASNALFAGDSNKLGGMTADQFVLIGDPRLTDNRNPLPGSANYIQNTNNQQTANFNVSGNGTIGGDLTVGGTTSFNILNAQSQYNFGGQRFLSGNEPSGNIFAGFGTGNTTMTGVANSFFGIRAGKSVTSGYANVFLGADSGVANTTGTLNVFVGAFAGYENQTGGSNTFVGFEAGKSNKASGNAFFGTGSGYSNTTGDSNSFFGFQSGNLNTSGINNSFFGTYAGAINTTGGSNAFFGTGAGYANQTGSQNSFFGYQSGNNSLGAGNTFYGYKSGLANTVGGNNTIIGAGADLGANNLTFATAIGAGAVVSTNNTIALGRANGADTVLIPGNLSVNGSLGFNILNAQTQYNLGGSRVLSGDAQNGNVFAGFNSGGATTGANNSFFGTGSGTLTTTGFSNVFIGTNAGGKNIDGYYNTAVGVGAANSNTSGNQNSFFGFLSGSGTTTGTNNTFYGVQTGSINTTGSNNTAIGFGATFNANNLTFATAIGAGAVVKNNNTVVLGRDLDFVNVPGNFTAEKTAFFLANVNMPNGTLAAGIISLAHPANNGTQSLCLTNAGLIGFCSSSIRYKKDVENFTGGLDLIRKLRPVSFTWKSNDIRDIGFVAEEVNKVEPLLNNYNAQGEIEGVKYDRISTALVNAVNEQQTEIESQRKQIEEQKTLIETQQKQIDALTKAICAQNPKAEVCEEKK